MLNRIIIVTIFVVKPDIRALNVFLIGNLNQVYHNITVSIYLNSYNCFQCFAKCLGDLFHPNKNLKLYYSVWIVLIDKLALSNFSIMNIFMAGYCRWTYRLLFFYPYYQSLFKVGEWWVSLWCSILFRDWHKRYCNFFIEGLFAGLPFILVVVWNVWINITAIYDQFDAIEDRTKFWQIKNYRYCWI